MADSSVHFGKRGLDMALRAMDLYEARAWYEQLKADRPGRRLAVKAAGVIGDPDLIADLISFMGVPALARLAGEATSMITGADLAYLDLAGDAPENFEAGPTESADDENVEMDEDENLPWPAPALVDKWWRENRTRFRTGTRYLRGKEMTPEGLGDALTVGKQRQRAAAALELGLREPLRPLFEVRARGMFQMRALGQWNW
jgi:uncharacterized protein (TIGR02270 family)